MADYFENNFLNSLSTLAKKNNPIDQNLYQKYNVRRGLRYPDGRGVLVGLTRVGDVVGYEVKDDKKVAIPGKLFYRGYNIEDLISDAENNDDFCFEQTVYLLLFGELPTQSELDEFKEFMGTKRILPQFFFEDIIMKSPSNDIMNKLAHSVLACYSYDKDPENRSIENNLRQCIELISRFPVLVAYEYQAKRRYFEGKSMYIHNPNLELSTAENILRLIRRDKEFTKLEAEILDLALILHAEHGGGNNSSLTVHVVSSADTDTYSAIASAVGSLKGRRHGGANNQVMAMMDDIKDNVANWEDEQEVKEYLRKIIRKEAFDQSGLIYGIGHAVYTISDPRAVLLKKKAYILAKAKGQEFVDNFALYELIEKLAPIVYAEEKNNDKKVCANVDFYSGFIYTMLGIPRELFTPIFATSRVAGWSAHRIEEIVSGGRIYRPAYKNILEPREFIPMKNR